MFLFVKGAKAGVFKGESQDAKHKDEIEIEGWSWGIQGRQSVGNAMAATGKASVLELKIVKRLDSSSTAFMSAMRFNEAIVEARLTVRKAGTNPLEYFKITIEQGRVISVLIDGGRGEAGASVVERISFAFNKINVEYIPQGPDGQARGATSFQDQFNESA